MFDRLLTQFPDCDQARLAALATVWTRELELILARMFEICADRGAVRIPAGARHEAVFELAKLSLWLEDKIVSVKTAKAPIHEIDPVIEAQSIATEDGRERIENTARNCAEGVWKRFHDEWWQKYPEIETGRKRGSKLPGHCGDAQHPRRASAAAPAEPPGGVGRQFRSRGPVAGPVSRRVRVQQNEEEDARWLQRPFVSSRVGVDSCLEAGVADRGRRIMGGGPRASDPAT
jgi:hypothetical protein